MSFDGLTRISRLIHHLEREIWQAAGEKPQIHGMALRPDVYKAFATEIVMVMPLIKDESGIPAMIEGVPYVVFGVTAKTPKPDGTAAVWAPDVTVFTDAEVWKRFLQHTDD